MVPSVGGVIVSPVTVINGGVGTSVINGGVGKAVEEVTTGGVGRSEINGGVGISVEAAGVVTTSGVGLPSPPSMGSVGTVISVDSVPSTGAVVKIGGSSGTTAVVKIGGPSRASLPEMQSRDCELKTLPDPQLR